jgi:hypothetical protein
VWVVCGVAYDGWSLRSEGIGWCEEVKVVLLLEVVSGTVKDSSSPEYL